MSLTTSFDEKQNTLYQWRSVHPNYRQFSCQQNGRGNLSVNHTNGKHKGKAWRQCWKINFHLLYLEVSSLPNLASSPDLTIYSDAWMWLEDSLMYRLCGDAEEMDRDHIQRCQSLTDAMDSVSNLDRQWRLSTLYWTARKKTGFVIWTGVGLKTLIKRLSFVFQSVN